MAQLAKITAEVVLYEQNELCTYDNEIPESWISVFKALAKKTVTIPVWQKKIVENYTKSTNKHLFLSSKFFIRCFPVLWQFLYNKKFLKHWKREFYCIFSSGVRGHIHTYHSNSQTSFTSHKIQILNARITHATPTLVYQTI